MIVDTSALFAIAFGEPDRDRFSRALAGTRTKRMSAPTLVEATLVAEGYGGERGRGRFEALLAQEDIEVVDFTAEHALLAIAAWRRFGKGRHPAGLNICDCMAYALARSENAPLLFKGNDFGLTDIEPALKD